MTAEAAEAAEATDAAEAACAALAALGIAVDAAGLATELARRTPPPDARHLVELALAWACMRGDPAALIHVERTYFAQARRSLLKLKLSPTLADDVLGWMRFELFVRPDRPLVATYSGRGDLGAWVRAIAVHEAVKRERKARREVTPDALAELPMPEPDLLAMRGAYGAALTRALSDSFHALAADDRTLLRRYFLDGLTIDMLAKLYQIHRATAARRVAAARTELVDRVRKTLRRDLALSDASVDQVITLSNLDQSLSQLLRQTT